MADKKEQLAQALFDHIPVGVGSQGIIATNTRDLDTILEMGMDYSVREVQDACMPVDVNNPFLQVTHLQTRSSMQD